MRTFVGGSASDDAALSEDMAEAADLLRGYLRHLRVLEDGAVIGAVDAELEAATTTYTWSDTRDLEPDDDTGPVPASVLDRAHREVTSDLFVRRTAPGGIVNAQFAGADGLATGPARLHRDPLTPAYPLLGRWTVPF